MDVQGIKENQETANNAKIPKINWDDTSFFSLRKYPLDDKTKKEKKLRKKAKKHPPINCEPENC